MYYSRTDMCLLTFNLPTPSGPFVKSNNYSSSGPLIFFFTCTSWLRIISHINLHTTKIDLFPFACLHMQISIDINRPFKKKSLKFVASELFFFLKICIWTWEISSYTTTPRTIQMEFGTWRDTERGQWRSGGSSDITGIYSPSREGRDIPCCKREVVFSQRV